MQVRRNRAEIEGEQDQMFNEPVASLMFHQILFYEHLYLYIYSVIQIVCFIFKNTFLPIPNDLHLRWDWALIFGHFLVTFTRVIMGKSGNKLESSKLTGNFIVLSIGSIIGYVYLMRIQTFVLLLELIINIIGLAICCLSFIAGFLNKGKFA